MNKVSEILFDRHMERIKDRNARAQRDAVLNVARHDPVRDVTDSLTLSNKQYQDLLEVLQASDRLVSMPMEYRAKARRLLLLLDI